VILGLWGIESTFGDPLVQQNHSRPVFPALAALAWGEPRRRSYWETELINALRIVEKGWSNPKEMVGSWAGAMGHTQWMPEVWLNVGFDYDGDGKVNPFGRPDDALGSSARYLVNRGKYRRGEHWGYEGARAGAHFGRDIAHLRGLASARRDARRRATVSEPEAHRQAVGAGRGRAGISVGPELLRGAQLQPVDELHARDRASRRPRARRRPVRAAVPGSERAPTLAEVQEMQKRLTAAASTPAAPTAASAT
jgi:hypothetical protein